MSVPASAVLDLEHFLPYRLSVLSNTVSTALAGAYARRFGLSIPQWRVIAVLARIARAFGRRRRRAHRDG